MAILGNSANFRVIQGALKRAPRLGSGSKIHELNQIYIGELYTHNYLNQTTRNAKI